MSEFKELQSSLQEIADLRSAAALLMWDKETYMPVGGAARRARQQGTLAGIIHQKFLDEVRPKARALAGKDAGLSPIEQADLREILKEVDRTEKLPLEFVKKITQTTSEAQSAWIVARETNSFEPFEPKLTELVQLKREQADYWGYETARYDAHLDIYHAGQTTINLLELFADLKKSLKDIYDRIDPDQPLDDAWIRQHISKETQLELSKEIVAEIGYDFQHGRQDLSAHPFTLPLSPEDVRITTSVKENEVLWMLFCSIHEGGHAIYEQGLDRSRYGLPSGEATSISIHESQSRLYENNLGRSREYAAHLYAKLLPLLPEKPENKGPEDLYRVINRLKPGLRRIEADELTYHFHIILRFELEEALINGTLEVKDLPEAWKAKMQETLGLTVNSPNLGPQQDIHWAVGNFGYFPTYTLGSLYAAQFFAQAEKEIPGLRAGFAKGEFSALKKWLNEKVHQHGKVYSSEELCQRITGESLKVEYFVTELTEKLKGIYQLRGLA